MSERIIHNLIFAFLVIIELSFASVSKAVIDPNKAPYAEPNVNMASEVNEVEATEYNRTSGRSRKETWPVIGLLMFGVALVSLYFTKKTADAAQKSALAAENTARAARTRLVDRIDRRIEDHFGSSGFPPDKEYSIQLLNTGREVIRLDYVKCEAEPEGAFDADVLSVDVGNNNHFENVRSSIPMLAGFKAVVSLRVYFNRSVLQNESKCRGKLSFALNPVLDTGDRSLEIECEFSSG